MTTCAHEIHPAHLHCLSVACKMDKPNRRVRPIRKVEPQIPDPSANDNSRAALQAAARNYKLAKDQWCDCEELHDSVYFRSQRTGYRGWMCVRCFGVTQAG